MIRKNGGPRREIDWAAVHHRIAVAGDNREAFREMKDAILVERARALARPIETGTARTTDLSLVTFSLAGERYGIEAQLVIEIGRLSDFSPLPAAPSHLVGVTNLRGEILPIFDLRALLGLNRRALDDLSRLLVLGNDRAEFGILADATRELTELASSEVLPSPPSVSTEARRFMRGVTKDALVVLDGKVLLEDRRLFCDQEDEARP